MNSPSLCLSLTTLLLVAPALSSSAQADAANLPKPSQPELVVGFWYHLACDDSPFQYTHDDRIDWDDPAEWPIPATLDDLAHEVEGSRITLWMIEGRYGSIQTFDGKIMADWNAAIAREYAAACHIPIITEAQWLRLTKEAGK